MPRQRRAQLRSGVCLLLLTVSALVLAPVARAQEQRVPLIFTGDLLSLIATDNQGEQSAEIANRIIGLSPAVRNVRLQRAGGQVRLFLTTGGAEEIPVSFQFSLDKMVYYRMLTARADINGVTEALKEAKAGEPLLREIGYRYDGRYSIIDLTVDLRQAVRAARDTQARREVEERAEAAAQAAPSVKAAAPQPAVPAPEEKPPPLPKETAPPPPVKEAAYLSAKGLGREAAPVLDGQASDAAWQALSPLSFEVTGASGKMTVTAAARWSSERIWVLVRWPDRRPDDVHRPWVWSNVEKAYVAGREVEDALSLSFSREGRMGECMLAGNEASLDVWTWRAGRTDPSGFADDATMILSFQRLARANSYQTRNGRSIWVKEEPDAGSPPYQAQIVGAYAGERIPRYIARTPSGSMADVLAKGSWKEGFWTVEFSRRLSTGHREDVVFYPGLDIFFSVAVFNSREGIDHSTSKELKLRLE